MPVLPAITQALEAFTADLRTAPPLPARSYRYHVELALQLLPALAIESNQVLKGLSSTPPASIRRLALCMPLHLIHALQDLAPGRDPSFDLAVLVELMATLVATHADKDPLWPSTPPLVHLHAARRKLHLFAHVLSSSQTSLPLAHLEELAADFTTYLTFFLASFSRCSTLPLSPPSLL